MRSYLSVAMPDTCPRIQLLGSGFGQKGSTWNRGTAVCADAGLALAMSAIVALSHTIAAFMSSSRTDPLRLDARSRAAARAAWRAAPVILRLVYRRVARLWMDYSASTATPPGTALMAPPTCGET